MLKSDFYYDLPEELIAQTPIEPRDGSGLMKIDRETGGIIHDRFYNICRYLKKGDLLVLNDSKVFPARIYGIKPSTGVNVEFLLLNHIESDKWEVMVRPGRRLKAGTIVKFSDELSAEILDIADGGNRIVRNKHVQTKRRQGNFRRHHKLPHSRIRLSIGKTDCV